MSGDWTPVHHVHADEPDQTEPDQGKTPAKETSDGKKPAAASKPEKAAPVSLSLNLPDDFTAAVKELAAALKENTAAIQALLTKGSE